MKQKHLFPLIAFLTVYTGQAQVQNRMVVPDIKGYKTLQCDFHVHTAFSDATVWPTVRVEEAYREGIDAIAITDHLEYQAHGNDVVATRNRSYEIARYAANSYGIIVIPGAEITRPMPPGHFNAIFISDAEALVKEDWRETFVEAKRQNAFIFWNHPCWDVQSPDTTLWWKEHTEIYNNGWMNGLEVFNDQTYCPEGFQWALDKKMTLISVSDSHQPMQTDIDFANGERRPVTLVFAKERTAEAIREALDNQRTVAYFKSFLAGEEQYIRSIFENSIEITNVNRRDNRMTLTILNKSGLTFRLKKTTSYDKNVVYFRYFEIKPYSRHSIPVRFLNDNNDGKLNFEVTNLLIKPGKGLEYSYNLHQLK